MLVSILVEFKDGVLLQLYERHPAFLAVIPVLALLFYAGALTLEGIEHDGQHSHMGQQK